MNDREFVQGNAFRDAPPLAERLRARIRLKGAITFRDFMQAALYDERGGYYQQSNIARWGRAGDYRTSPESSSLFAITFANYFAALYEKLGAPTRWTIFEAGAGAGDFARGLLEALRQDYPRVFQATLYVIDEASSDARGRAADRLAHFGERVEFRRLAETKIFNEPCIFFSNELLDAFPIHRIQFSGGDFLELYVDVDEHENFYWKTGKLSKARLAEFFEGKPNELIEKQIIEVNLAAADYIRRVGKLVQKGYVVTVDYGAETAGLRNPPHRLTGTLRAIRRHQFAENLLSCPGEQDLTSTIDWTHIKEAGDEAGLQTILFARQDEFLLQAGLLEMLEREAARAPTEAERTRLRLEAREMILPERMSGSFQVLVQEKRS
ncbi:MAG: class I SAM-dependent methyltransferase [Pyrinomonadaceae bacterium]